MPIGISLLPLSFFLPVAFDFFFAGTSNFSLIDIPRADPSDPQSILISIILVAVFDYFVSFSVCLRGDVNLKVDFMVLAPADEFRRRRLGFSCFDVFGFSTGFASMSLGLDFVAALPALARVSRRLAISCCC